MSRQNTRTNAAKYLTLKSAIVVLGAETRTNIFAESFA